MNNNLGIIIPCYNEQDNIKEVLIDLKPFLHHGTPIVINDGSKDNTSKAVKQCEYAILIELPFNLGIGTAVQTGLIFAKENYMNYAVKLDGDGQHPPEQIKELLEVLQTDNADIVVGSRFLRNDSKGFKSTYSRRIGIRFLQKVCKLLTGQIITDPTSGFRAYNRKAIEFMAEHYPSFDYPEPEEIILAAKNDLRIKEIPVIMRKRQHGNSSISTGNSIYYMLKVTLAMFFTAIRKKEKISKRQ